VVGRFAARAADIVPSCTGASVPLAAGRMLPSQALPPTLAHLPSHKRAQITAIAALVQASAPVEMVLLFASYARGDWVEDLAQGYFSDFDLMVIVENAALAEDDALWPKVASEAGRISGRIPVTLFGARHQGVLQLLVPLRASSARTRAAASLATARRPRASNEPTRARRSR
jgi:hypothetical protein